MFKRKNKALERIRAELQKDIWDRTIIVKAKAFAREAHAGQVRRGTNVPYHTHTEAVAALVAKQTSDSYMIVAALLHDTLEDTDIRFGDIASLFNTEIAMLVQELTNEYEHSTYPDLIKDERKNLELERLKRVSYKAKLIKKCDITHNLSDNPKTTTYYRQLLKALR